MKTSTKVGLGLAALGGLVLLWRRSMASTSLPTFAGYTLPALTPAPLLGPAGTMLVQSFVAGGMPLDQAQQNAYATLGSQ